MRAGSRRSRATRRRARSSSSRVAEAALPAMAGLGVVLEGEGSPRRERSRSARGRTGYTPALSESECSRVTAGLALYPRCVDAEVAYLPDPDAARTSTTCTERRSLQRRAMAGISTACGARASPASGRNALARVMAASRRLDVYAAAPFGASEARPDASAIARFEVVGAHARSMRLKAWWSARTAKTSTWQRSALRRTTMPLLSSSVTVDPGGSGSFHGEPAAWGSGAQRGALASVRSTTPWTWPSVRTAAMSTWHPSSATRSPFSPASAPAGNSGSCQEGTAVSGDGLGRVALERPASPARRSSESAQTGVTSTSSRTTESKSSSGRRAADAPADPCDGRGWVRTSASRARGEAARWHSRRRKPARRAGWSESGASAASPDRGRLPAITLDSGTRTPLVPNRYLASGSIAAPIAAGIIRCSGSPRAIDRGSRAGPRSVHSREQP
jgi:hypothetical protein